MYRFQRSWGKKLSNMQNKQTYKDKNIHTRFTQVTHYNDAICENSFFIESKTGRAISHVINININSVLQIVHMFHFNNTYKY